MPIFPSGPLTVYRRAAMASDFEVSLNATRDDSGADAALDALDEVDRIENVLSIFRPTTLASRVNLLAAELNVRVDEEFWGWLETAIRFSEETDGAFDVAAAPIWRAWGFAKRDGEFPAPDVIERALELSGTRHLQLDEAERSIAFDEEGVELNFGAIGKGIALDAAAQKLLDGGQTDFLIQGGKSGCVARGGRLNDELFVFGDFSEEAAKEETNQDATGEADETRSDAFPKDAVFAFGAAVETVLTQGLSAFSASNDAKSRGGESDETEDDDPEFDEESGRRRRTSRRDDEEAVEALIPEFLRPDAETERLALLSKARRYSGWTIGVAHPLFPERRIGEIFLRDRALGTSGSTYQFFRCGGKRYSHVVDPRTGYPTTGVLSTTVLAPTATAADALSTAFFVLGPEKTAAFCANRPEIGALLVLERETSPGFEIATFNLGPDVWRPL
ncbi:MAG: FAD:protein FMN transferase [Thermoguttaceae bacterium]|nr:FAD:protein FMN transferase [Thermoguttaceae bacterium]